MGGVLNHRVGPSRNPYKLDVAFPDKKIVIEYDSWYAHAGREDHDAKRDAFLLAGGWGIVHVKSNEKVPSKQQLEVALAKLGNEKKVVEIVLDDWGKGVTFIEVLAKGNGDPWGKGPVSISFDGTTVSECQQLGLW